MSIAKKDTIENRNGEFDLVSLFSDCKRKKYRLNELIFTPLSYSNKIYFLINGKVNVTIVSDKGRTVSAGYYKKGDLINLEVINNGKKRKVTANSKSKNTMALVISKSNFLRKLSAIPELQRYVLRKLLLDKANAEERFQRVLDIPSTGRVYTFLYHHALRFGERVGYEYVIREPLTHQEIGVHIGCSRQTVTTSMNIIRREGIIHFNRRYWIIRDPGGLKKIVDEL